ncbi:MAG: hypothetical protein VKJ02_14080 [Snowella sp.]|nr:hypothetical protein [Snowella sp.]
MPIENGKTRSRFNTERLFQIVLTRSAPIISSSGNGWIASGIPAE